MTINEKQDEIIENYFKEHEIELDNEEDLKTLFSHLAKN